MSDCHWCGRADFDGSSALANYDEEVREESESD